MKRRRENLKSRIEIRDAKELHLSEGDPGNIPVCPCFMMSYLGEDLGGLVVLGKKVEKNCG